MSKKIRVRLVFETVVTDEELAENFNSAESVAADKLKALLSNDELFTDQIFSETKILRPFTKKAGVTYGRPKLEPDTFGLD